jgi:hypothetical protein
MGYEDREFDFTSLTSMRARAMTSSIGVSSTVSATPGRCRRDDPPLLVTAMLLVRGIGFA